MRARRTTRPASRLLVLIVAAACGPEAPSSASDPLPAAALEEWIACRPSLSDASAGGDLLEQGRDERMADLMRRVAVTLPIRPLDPATWDLASERMLEASVDDLAREVEHMLPAASIQSCDPGPTVERIARRLSELTLDHGLQDVSDDPHLVDLARRAVTRFDAGDRVEDLPADAQVLRALLLELAGRRDEAWQALLAVQVHHWCGNCADALQAPLDLRRSEMAERRGDLREAWEQLATSVVLFSGAPNDRSELARCRAGLLLLRLGCARAGASVLQSLVDLFPATRGAAVAEAALRQVGSYQPPTVARLRAAYVDGDGRHESPYAAQARVVIERLESGRPR